MKSSPSISLKPIISFITHYHFLLVFLLVFGSLGVGILMLGGVVASSDQASGYTSSVDKPITFDGTTIERLRSLKGSGESTEKLPFSSGRTNPF